MLEEVEVEQEQLPQLQQDQVDQVVVGLEAFLEQEQQEQLILEAEEVEDQDQDQELEEPVDQESLLLEPQVQLI
jgi:hypothetical protein